MNNYNDGGTQNKGTPQTRKRVGKVVSGSVKTKEKSEIRKFADVFLAEDVESVKKYAILDVIKPLLKQAIDDIVSNGIKILLYHGEGYTPKRQNSQSRTSYGSFYSENRGRPRNENSERTTGNRRYLGYMEAIFDSRIDAQATLDALYEYLEAYQIVSVGDYYEAAGLNTKPTDFSYGWTDLSTARIVHTPDGYMIRLPKASPLD